MLDALFRFLARTAPDQPFIPAAAEAPPAPAKGRDVTALLAPLARSALHLTRSDAASRSWLGGDPALPPDVAWPSERGVALKFLARLSLADAQAVLPLHWLPQEGALLFFRGHSHHATTPCVVLLVDDLSAPVSHTVMTGSGSRTRAVPSNLQLRAIQSLPPLDHPQVEAHELTDDECDSAVEAVDAQSNGLPNHQLAGHDMPIQVGAGRMEIDCEAAATGRRLSAVTATDAAGSAWRPLLQLDEEPELSMRWGRPGMLYIWVREKAAERGDFSGCMLCLQT